MYGYPTNSVPWHVCHQPNMTSDNRSCALPMLSVTRAHHQRYKSLHTILHSLKQLEQRLRIQPINQMVQQMYSIKYTTLVVNHPTSCFLALTSIVKRLLKASATTDPSPIYVFRHADTPQVPCRAKPKQLMCLAQTHGCCQTDVAVLILPGVEQWNSCEMCGWRAPYRSADSCGWITCMACMAVPPRGSFLDRVTRGFRGKYELPLDNMDSNHID